jgi:pyrophosphatase PpaX
MCDQLHDPHTSLLGHRISMIEEYHTLVALRLYSRNVKYKYLLLDWDGCLIDSLNVWHSALKQRLADLGVQATDEEVVEKVMGIRDVPANFGLDMTPAEFWDPARDVVVNLVREANLHAGVEETMKHLFDNEHSIGIVTSTARRIYEEGLGDRIIRKYIRASVTGTDVEDLKPSPQAIYSLMEQLGGSSHETLIVGDSPHDVEAGKNAGIDTCIYYPKENELFYSFEELLNHAPTFFIEKFPDLLDIVT